MSLWKMWKASCFSVLLLGLVLPVRDAGAAAGDPPQISVSAASVTEGNSGQSDLVFTVTLSQASFGNVSFDFAAGDGSAKAGVDYLATSGSRTFAPGQTGKTVVVPIKGDTIDEANETLLLTLSNPVDATIAAGQGIGTVIDNDPPPLLSVSGATVAEGEADIINAVFTLTLSAASEQTASVDVATSDGTALAGQDYQPVNRTVIFAPGQVSATVHVPVLGDRLDEEDETFALRLTGAVNAMLQGPLRRLPANNHYYERVNATLDWDAAKAAAEARTVAGVTGHLATITSQSEQNLLASLADNNEAWIGAFQPAGSVEPAGGFQWITGEPFVYTNWIGGEPNNEPLVGIVDAIHFKAAGGWNDVSTKATYNYYLVEYDLAPGTPGPGMGVITDDDATPSLIVSNARTFAEGSAAAPGSTSFTVTLSAASGKTVTVNYQTASGTATAGADYVAKSGTLSFAPGQTAKFVKADFIGDSVAEANETLFLDLRTPLNATLADSRGSAYIRNDDGPSLTINNAITVDEGKTGTRLQTFTVTLSAASTNTVTVNWSTANGTAGPADYTVASGTLTFVPGETSKVITISVKGDTVVEPTETYRVNLSSPTYAVLADSQGVGYIRNDDVSALLFEDEPSQ